MLHRARQGIFPILAYLFLQIFRISRHNLLTHHTIEQQSNCRHRARIRKGRGKAHYQVASEVLKELVERDLGFIIILIVQITTRGFLAVALQFFSHFFHPILSVCQGNRKEKLPKKHIPSESPGSSR